MLKSNLVNKNAVAKKVFNSCVVIVTCCLLSSCIRVATKSLSFLYDNINGSESSSLASANDPGVEIAKNTSTIGSKIYTSKIGDAVTLKLASNVLFIDSTANRKPEFYSDLKGLAKNIARYKHNYIQVNVNFQADSETNFSRQVAENQASNVVDGLSQFLSSSLSSSKGDVVLKSKIFNREYSSVGNYIEIVLT
ncbi:MAG: hypothetical protein HON55_03505 [Legionellales bacterium]|jgi:hypothetical protein|nr:hypothetical protein [Legionellales bacterium]